MLALIGISNLVVIYFGGLMYINGSIKALEQLLNLFCTLICSRGLLPLGWVSSMVQEAEASQKTQ
jgi:ATP-binding cassette subfamily B protein